MFRCGNQQAHHVACWHKTDVAVATVDVCFSNRPFGVKRFQTIHHHSVDVAHGLVLLFGIGTKALPVWDSKTRRNNLSGGLAVSRRQNQADMRTHLIHRPARDIFHCSVELVFPPIELILWTPHAAATDTSNPAKWSMLRFSF